MNDFYSEKIIFNYSSQKEAIENIAALVERLAAMNAEKFGYDKNSLDNSLAWIVCKIRFDIAELPISGSSVLTETWPLPPLKIKVNRQYSVKNMQGIALIAGASEWCLINSNTRRPLRIEGNLAGEAREYFCEESGAGAYHRSTEALNKDKAYTYTVLESDIDANNHTNNNRYTAMVLGAFSDKFLCDNKIKAYELHFLRETRLGDTIEIFTSQTDYGLMVTGTVDAVPVFNAFLEF